MTTRPHDTREEFLSVLFVLSVVGLLLAAGAFLAACPVGR